MKNKHDQVHEVKPSGKREKSGNTLNFKPHTEIVSRRRANRYVARAGVNGLDITDGFLSQSQGIKDLVDPVQRYYIYRAMGADLAFASIFNAFQFLIGSVSWDAVPNISPGNSEANSEQLADAQFLRECMNDMDQPFSEYASSMIKDILQYGNIMRETGYKQRNGMSPSMSRTSLYTDGNLGWSSFDPRTMDTILRYDITDRGEFRGIVQTWRGRNYYVPANRLIHLYFDTEKKDPTGKSILFAAYESWVEKKKLENHRNQGIARDLGPLPILYFDAKMLDVVDEKPILDSDGKEQFDENGKVIMSKIYRDPAKAEYVKELLDALAEAAENKLKALAIPSLYGPGGQQTMRVESLRPQSSTNLSDTNNVINGYDENAIRSVMASFLVLGSGSTGSRALSEDQSTLFIRAISRNINVLRDYFNNVVIPRLFEANGLSRVNYPKIEYTDLTKDDADKRVRLIMEIVRNDLADRSVELKRYIANIVGYPYIENPEDRELNEGGEIENPDLTTESNHKKKEL